MSLGDPGPTLIPRLSANVSASLDCRSSSCCTTACTAPCSCRRNRHRSHAHHIFGFACDLTPREDARWRAHRHAEEYRSVPLVPTDDLQSSLMKWLQDGAPHALPEWRQQSHPDRLAVLVRPCALRPKPRASALEARGRALSHVYRLD